MKFVAKRLAIFSLSYREHVKVFNPFPLKTLNDHSIGPDSLVVRALASGAVGRGFAPRSRHTKGVKMVLEAPLLTFALKG